MCWKNGSIGNYWKKYEEKVYVIPEMENSFLNQNWEIFYYKILFNKLKNFEEIFFELWKEIFFHLSIFYWIIQFSWFFGWDEVHEIFSIAIFDSEIPK